MIEANQKALLLLKRAYELLSAAGVWCPEAADCYGDLVFYDGVDCDGECLGNDCSALASDIRIFLEKAQ